MARTLASYEAVLERFVQEAEDKGLDGPAMREAKDMVESFREESMQARSRLPNSSSSSLAAQYKTTVPAMAIQINMAELIHTSLAK